MSVGFNNRAHLKKLHGDAAERKLVGRLRARQPAANHTHNIRHA
jgi:hypothetical protein